MSQPTTGGRYIRDAQTGALARVADVEADAPAPEATIPAGEASMIAETAPEPAETKKKGK